MANPKKHLTTEEIEQFLIDHIIAIRAIPGQVWLLSFEPQGRHPYQILEEEGPRIRAGLPPRCYSDESIAGILLALLADPRLAEEGRQAKYEEKYPIEEGSNVVRLEDLRKKRRS